MRLIVSSIYHLHLFLNTFWEAVTGMPPGEVIWACPAKSRLQARPRVHLRDYVSGWLLWPRCSPEELEAVTGERRGVDISAKTAALVNYTWISMDGTVKNTDHWMVFRGIIVPMWWFPWRIMYIFCAVLSEGPTLSAFPIVEWDIIK